MELVGIIERELKSANDNTSDDPKVKFIFQDQM